ncbi:hypothetical protein SLA2020_406940 [Shorea laevis]
MKKTSAFSQDAMDVGQPMVQLMRPSGSVLQQWEGSNNCRETHAQLGLPANFSPSSGGVHSTPDSPKKPVACIATPLPAESATTPGRGWKKRAHAFSQAAVPLQQEDNQEQMRGEASLVGKQKRKVDLMLSKAQRSNQNGTESEFSSIKKARPQGGDLGLQDHDKGVAVADIQPRRSL